MKKEIQAMQISHSMQIAELKAANATKKTSAVSELEQMERELESVREEKAKLAKALAEQEKNMQARINSLKDEGQLLQQEAAKAERLEQQLVTLRKRLEEAEALKDTVKLLESKCREYMAKAVEAENANSSGKEMKIMLDSYRKQVLEAENTSSERLARIAELEAALDHKERNLSAAVKQQRLAELKLEAAVADYEAKLNNAGGSGGTAATLDDHERLLRLEKENELLRRGNVSSDAQVQLIELKCSLDAALRREEKLQRDCKAALARAALLEEQQPSGGGGATDSTQLQQVEKELAIKRAELEGMREKLAATEARIETEKQSAVLQEGVLKAQLAEELRKSENRVKYFVIQRNEQTEVHRREQGFMTAAFHELGIRYIKMRQTCESLEAQLEAIKMKAAAGKRKRRSTSQLMGERRISRSMASSHFSNE